MLVPAAAPAAPAADGERIAYSIAINGEIALPADIKLRRAILEAREARAELLIVRLNTPGGTADNTRRMIESMIAAPMPVVVFVHPSGGRADSAGLMLTLASDVAAMAPATNIGSATPVRAGPSARNADEARTLRTMTRKFTNSTVAFARSLAEEHSRNADLAERMIRDATNVSARRARAAGLVEVVVASEQALLARLDGFRVAGRKAQRLRTEGMTIRRGGVEATGLTDQTTSGDSSWGRALLLVGGSALTLLLVVTGLRRGRRLHRRRRRKRQVRRRQAERERRG